MCVWSRLFWFIYIPFNTRAADNQRFQHLHVHVGLGFSVAFAPPHPPVVVNRFAIIERSLVSGGAAVPARAPDFHDGGGSSVGVVVQHQVRVARRFAVHRWEISRWSRYFT